MAKSPHTDGERGIVPDWWAIGITRRLQVHDRLHQQPEDGQPGVVRQGGEGGKCVFSFHISSIIEVKQKSRDMLLEFHKTYVVYEGASRKYSRPIRYLVFQQYA